MGSNSTSYNPIRFSGVIGTLMLLAFLAYGMGRQFFDSEQVLIKSSGALLILTNSAIVIAIGILFRKTLLAFAPFVANLYLSTRVFEGIALGSIVFTSALGVLSLDVGYFIGMIVLGLGSIPMCITLIKFRLSPSWLAIWGIGGYAVFTIAFILQWVGMDWGIYLIIPAGLWEVVFATWLIRTRNQIGLTKYLA